MPRPSQVVRTRTPAPRRAAGKASPPGSWRRFVERWPEVAAAYDVLSDVCRTGGPLAPGQVAIVKLAVSVGRGTPRTVHSHAKKALRAGCDPGVLRQVALVALPTVGLPAMLDALGWIEESIQEERLSAWRSPDDPAVTSR